MSVKCGTTDCWRFFNRLCLASLLLPLLIIIGACNNSTHIAPVEQFDQPPGIKLNYHTVSSGDTLYSIAWRYGVDYRELVSINNIPSPYNVEIGQKILLSETAVKPSRPTAARGVQVIAVPADTNPVTEVGAVTEVKPGAVAPPSLPVAHPIVKHNVEHSVKQSGGSVASAGVRWIWPAAGRIISRFSTTDALSKGIDLEGKLGDPVEAASSGNVVYAGSGLTGYGQLVIIKHDDQFLSAYGHNSRLLVKEGDTVTGGQKIAEIGSSGTDTNKLHFEIRLAGKPVDPMLYLPKK